MDQAEPHPGPDKPERRRHPDRDPDPVSGAGAAAPPGHPVVAGYDGSPSSRHALAYAVGMAKRLGRPLLVIHVSPAGIYCEPLSGQVIGAPRDTDELEGWLLAELDDVCDPAGIDVRVVSRRGNAAKELAAAAAEFTADALVIGAPSHVWHHVAGSVPGWLARHAQCPVIVVP